MGLDMMLHADQMFHSFDDTQKPIVEEIQKLIPGCDGPSITVSTKAVYWRKANAIHKWFVDNVQNGNDDCGRYYVSKKKLKELRDLCQKVLNNPSQSIELLPTQGGFFFGNTNYDDYYMQDIRKTVVEIDKWLERAENTEMIFYYSSSW